MSKSTGNDSKIGKDEVVKLCPICKSDVRYFFVNFSEKVLLCENEFCDYPLGYEVLQFKNVDTGINLQKKSTVPSFLNSSDIAKLNETFESTKNDLMDLKLANSRRKKIPNKHTANIRTDQVTGESNYIKNEKWLKKLLKLQGSSRLKLVKKEEMKLLKQEIPKFGSGELKIDIESNENNSSINIQIMNKDGDRTTLEDVP